MTLLRALVVAGTVLLAACGGSQAPPPQPTPETAPPEPTAQTVAVPTEAAPPATEVPPTATAPAPKPTSPAAKQSALRLRSTPSELSRDEVTKMFAKRGFNHAYDMSSVGLPGVVKGDFKHDFEHVSKGGVPLVVDRATGLMWEKVGSYEHAKSGLVKATEVTSYVAGLNGSKLAGFDDWRLPTLEELASLIEPDKGQNGYHLDSGFEPGAMWFTLSSDTVKGDPSSVWTVDFGGGQVAEYSASDEYTVLLVRSMR